MAYGWWMERALWRYSVCSSPAPSPLRRIALPRILSDSAKTVCASRAHPEYRLLQHRPGNTRGGFYFGGNTAQFVCGCQRISPGLFRQFCGLKNEKYTKYSFEKYLAPTKNLSLTALAELCGAAPWGSTNKGGGPAGRPQSIYQQ